MSVKYTRHYDRQRYKRQYLINKYIKGDGNILDSFVIDRGHRNGAEVHTVTDTGLIIIYNQRSHKVITKLIARPKQIEKYYQNLNKEPPDWLLDLARWHTSLNYNRR